MEQGWIKLHRQLQDNPLWLEKPFDRARAWVDLILIANHKPGAIWKRGICIKIDRGEVGWSQIRLAERWGWSRGKVRRFLEYLKNESQIGQRTVQQTKHLTSLIIIENYNKYQVGGTSNGTASSTADGQQTDSRRYSNKNGKKGKNEKKKDIYADLKNVLLLAEEYKKLIDKFGKHHTKQKINTLGEYMASKGKTYKSHYATILSWSRKDEKEGKTKGGAEGVKGKYDGVGTQVDQG